LGKFFLITYNLVGTPIMTIFKGHFWIHYMARMFFSMPCYTSPYLYMYFHDAQPQKCEKEVACEEVITVL
jgi:hypothetical protein